MSQQPLEGFQWKLLQKLKSQQDEFYIFFFYLVIHTFFFFFLNSFLIYAKWMKIVIGFTAEDNSK